MLKYVRTHVRTYSLHVNTRCHIDPPKVYLTQPPVLVHILATYIGRQGVAVYNKGGILQFGGE